MAGIFHSFSASKGDPADSTFVGSTKWNSEHTVTTPSGSLLYGQGGYLSGALSASIDASGNLNIGEIQSAAGGYPPVPASGATLFVRNRADRRMLGTIGPNGIDQILMPHFARNKIAFWSPTGNTNAISTLIGAANLIPSGTATANAVAATPFSATLKRLGYVGAGTAQNGAGVVAPALQWFLGSEAGSGGFHMIGRVVLDSNGLTDAVRFFAGMHNTANHTGTMSIQPSGTTNCIGVMKNSSSANYEFCWNAGSGLVSSSDTGITFENGDALEVQIYAKSNASQAGISIQKLNSGTVATTVVTSNLPSNTTLLAPKMWIGNGAQATAVRLALSSLYMETDN